MLNGRIEQVKTDSTISTVSAAMLKEVISRLQFVQPNSSATAWETEEENTAGTFRATYQQLNAGNEKEKQYSKTNAGYTKLKAAQPEQKMLVNSQTNITVDSANAVKNITVSELQFVVINIDTISASGSKIEVSLRLTATATAAQLSQLTSLFSSLAYTRSTTLSAPLSIDQINRLAYTGTLENDNLQTLTQALAEVDQTDANYEETLVLKFRALAYLFPETAASLADLLVKAPHGSYNFRVLSQALANAQTPAATDAIATVVEKRSADEAVMINLLPTLATTTAPTDKAVEVVKTIAFDKTKSSVITSTAQLALGGMAYHFGKINPTKGEEVSRLLLLKMETETDTLQRILVLGNTGSPLVFPRLSQYVANDTASMEVKVAAIKAMQLIKQQEVDEFLVKLSTHTDSLIAKTAQEVAAARLLR